MTHARNFVALVFLIVTMQSLASNANLACYTCNSSEEPTCNDPFVGNENITKQCKLLNPNPTILDDEELSEKYSTSDRLTVCVKAIFVADDGTQTVRRECNHQGRRACKYFYQLAIQNKKELGYCAMCNDDLCNHVSTILPWTTTSLCLLLALASRI